MSSFLPPAIPPDLRFGYVSGSLLHHGTRDKRQPSRARAWHMHRSGRSDDAVPLGQPTEVRGLAHVLHVVVDHADEADTERHRRVPAVVDDAVEVTGPEA